METTHQPVHLAGSVLDRTRHVCAFFHSRDEEYRVLLPFVKEGFERGDKAFHITDPANIPEHLRQLQRAGVNVAGAQRVSQLEVHPWQAIHLREGRFDQKAMLELIAEVLTNGKAQGFPMTRFIANMEWSLEERPGVEEIVEYESRLNYLLPNFEDAVI
jgi:hypothetical protein